MRLAHSEGRLTACATTMTTSNDSPSPHRSSGHTIADLALGHLALVGIAFGVLFAKGARCEKDTERSALILPEDVSTGDVHLASVSRSDVHGDGADEVAQRIRILHRKMEGLYESLEYTKEDIHRLEGLRVAANELAKSVAEFGEDDWDTHGRDEQLQDAMSELTRVLTERIEEAVERVRRDEHKYVGWQKRLLELSRANRRTPDEEAA